MSGGKKAILCFEFPVWGGMYDVHLRFIGKRVVNFLSVTINIFLRMAEVLRAKIGIFEGVGQFGSKFQRERVIRDQPFFLLDN